MEGQYREIIRQKIVDALAAPTRQLTRRDVWLPFVPGKAVAVIGMRRAGKTSLLWQILADRLAQRAPREGLCISASKTSVYLEQGGFQGLGVRNRVGLLRGLAY